MSDRTNTATIALAGDTMLGRGVGKRLSDGAPIEGFVAPELVERMAAADLRVLNLECCISGRGEPWPAPGKPFFFRAPPRAVELVRHLGVDAVTLANNHALDYGHDALADTLALLDAAGIAHVGAGADVEAARAPAVLAASDLRMGLIGFADHPRDFAAGMDRSGTAFADLRDGLPGWVAGAIGDLHPRADVVLVTPHWGPNMRADPLPEIRAAAGALRRAGATLVAGHSAHVFQGVEGAVVYDLGDFVDDYAVDPLLRNDLGLLWLVTVGPQGPIRLEAIPLRLEYCHTRLATGPDAAWIRRRFRAACGALGTEVTEADGSLVVEWPQRPAPR